MRIDEIIGRAIGATVAPITFLGSLLRGNRLFHPDGVVYRAEVEPILRDGQLGRLAERLADGIALVRLSGALWEWPQGKRAPDLLGMVVRFRAVDEVSPRSRPGDQDLLLVTARSLPQLLTAAFSTNVSDFLANRYYAILPFTLEGVGKVYVRLVPMQGSPAGADRRERLALAVAQGKAVLRLELRRARRDEPWFPVAAIALREPAGIEDAKLAFDPGSTAKGLVPRGVLQWVRPAAYAASRMGWRLRQRRERGSAPDVAAASIARDAPYGETAEGGLEPR